MNWAVFILAVIAFWGVLEALYRWKKEAFASRGIEVQAPVLIWRLARSFGRLESAAGSRAVRALSLLGVALTLLAMLLYYFQIGGTALAKLTGAVSGEARTVQLVIPGITITGESLLYFIVAASIAIVLHELAHAVVAVNEGLSLKSAGLALFAVFPAAFVEPDEEEFNRAPRATRIKVLSAGSAVNLVLAFIGLVLVTYMLSAPGGFMVTQVEPGSPAREAGLMPGMVIVEVNGTRIDSLGRLKSLIPPYEEAVLNVTVEYEGFRRTLLVHKPANRTTIGVYLKPVGTLLSGLPQEWYDNLLQLVLWFHGINFGIAIVNAAPLFITDGAKILEAASEKLPLGRARKPLLYAVQTATLAILIYVLV